MSGIVLPVSLLSRESGHEYNWSWGLRWISLLRSVCVCVSGYRSENQVTFFSRNGSFLRKHCWLTELKCRKHDKNLFTGKLKCPALRWLFRFVWSCVVPPLSVSLQPLCIFLNTGLLCSSGGMSPNKAIMASTLGGHSSHQTPDQLLNSRVPEEWIWLV